MTECKILSRDEHHAEAMAGLKRSGYNAGGRLKQEEGNNAAKDARMTKKALAGSSSQEPSKSKYKRGGEVAGAAPMGRADKKSRGSKGVTINIISPAAAEAEKKKAAVAGLQAGAHMGAAAAMGGAGGAPGVGAGAPPPDMGVGPGGAPPPGAMGPMKRGGRAR
jgi:hypothetical protein